MITGVSHQHLALWWFLKMISNMVLSWAVEVLELEPSEYLFFNHTFVCLLFARNGFEFRALCLQNST
jgi:hypothetical protein